MQNTDYYPFGMDITRYQAVPNKYLYNGKEKQEELNQYDYGVRFYDPVIGRWHVIDPMAEKYYNATPYNYVLNNPLSLFDPDGRDAIIEYDRDKDGNITAIRIRSTIYFKGGSQEKRNEYIDAANKYVKDNSKLFSGTYKDADGNKIGISIDINYQDLGDKRESEIGAGNNIMDITQLDVTNGSSQANGGNKNIMEFVNGVWKSNGKIDYNTAGTMAALRDDSKQSPGQTTVHETMHLLGLTDRYTDSYPNNQRVSTVDKGFGGDIMAGGNKMHQTHWNNWGTYILTQPQVQQQQTQSPTQFILRYRVDVNQEGKKITRP